MTTSAQEVTSPILLFFKARLRITGSWELSGFRGRILPSLLPPSLNLITAGNSLCVGKKKKCFFKGTGGVDEATGGYIGSVISSWVTYIYIFIYIYIYTHNGTCDFDTTLQREFIHIPRLWSFHILISLGFLLHK